MQLSKKLKVAGCFFIAFLESTLNFEHFEKKEPHSLSISEIIDSERRLLNCIKSPVSKNPPAVNVFTSPKNCWNLQKSNFIPIFYQIELEKVTFS